jgi:hypothetical protein
VRHDDGLVLVLVLVLAVVKAKPYGWLAASLDPGYGRPQNWQLHGRAANRGGCPKIKSLRFQGIAGISRHLGDWATRLNHHLYRLVLEFRCKLPTLS